MKNNENQFCKLLQDAVTQSKCDYKEIAALPVMRLSVQTPHTIVLRLFLVLLSQDCPSRAKHVEEEKQRDLMMY